MIFTTTELFLLVGLVMAVIGLAFLASRFAADSEAAIREKRQSLDAGAAAPRSAPRGPRRSPRHR